ncbi:MAG: UbiD family decarboxylase, partial [Dehalococcoidia bacterium]|nr:UbiD family decarboxylase [Dehalococcoidia bacterium]
MAYKDLRQYLQRLEEEGELTHVEVEVDWDLEIGGISRRAIDRKSGALLFNHIKGYPQGYRILANPLGPSQPVHALFSLALNQPKDTHVLDLIDWFGHKTNECIRPTVVDR